MIAELQTALIELFEAAHAETAYPKQIKPYGGEMKNECRNVNHLPSLYVDVVTAGRITADDIEGLLVTGELRPEIILFDENKARGRARFGTLASGIDWVLNALKGQVVTVNDVPLAVGQDIQFRAIPDFFKPVAIITPTLTLMED
tara:strand:- start:155491 stop:155925 length:435 start_codon:yes stop_codon:yes gene_type:complete